MLCGIDHLVIVVKDLDLAARHYEQLGFTVIPGGKHPVGSHNVLIAFRDGSYLELIAFYREATDHRWWEPLTKGERLVDFCCVTDDLQGDTAKLRAAGVAINDPVPWSRTRPDGYELKWLLSLAIGRDRGVAPFLIQDLTPRNERVPQKFDHQNGATGIGTVIVAVAELSTAGSWYRTILGSAGEEFEHSVLRGRGLRLQIGRHCVEYVMPTATESPLAKWVRTYGPSPYGATLRSTASRTGVLDQALTHGANLFLE
jgi:hypothetical protein